MPTYLLDSSIIIDVLNRKRQRDVLLENLLLQGHLLACCCINVTEVFAGMRPSEKARTEDLLNSFEYYEVTRDIAKRAGLLKREWASKGITLALSDVTIAAVAIDNHLTLLTDNVKHYPMPGLQIYPLTPIP